MQSPSDRREWSNTSQRFSRCAAFAKEILKRLDFLDPAMTQFLKKCPLVQRCSVTVAAALRRHGRRSRPDRTTRRCGLGLGLRIDFEKLLLKYAIDILRKYGA